MARPRNRVYDALVAMVCLGFCHFTRLIPLELARTLGRMLGRLAYYFIPRVRRVALENVRFAFDDTLSPAQIRAMARGAAENMAIVAAEFSRLPQLHGEFLDRQVKLIGHEKIDRGRGVLMIGAHLANWEWMAAIMRNNFPAVVEVVRPLDNRRMDDYVDRIRHSQGVETLGKDHAGTEVIRRLRAGEIVGVLADQSPRENGVPVQFFGKPCWATVAPVMAAVRARVPVVPVAMARNKDGSYTVSVGDPIEMTRTGNLHEDLVSNSQRCQDAIEKSIRAHPEQWLWPHRRWKARPRLEAEWTNRTKRDTASPRTTQ